MPLSQFCFLYFCFHKDTKGKKPAGKKKSKEIDFDSDSELPGLDSKDTDVKKKKKPSSRGRKSKKKPDDDLFGDDDDLPGIYELIIILT